jgi:hypothetical protein
MSPEENQIMIDYLTKREFIYNNETRRSALIGGLCEVRKFAGRDIETGKPLHNRTESGGYQGHWLALLGYFAILDQMGSCFKDLNCSIKIETKEKAFNICLKRFATHLDIYERKAIYALRNSVAHDYCLINENNVDDKLRHHFGLYIDPKIPLVKVPSPLWDGVMAHRNSQNQTKINIDKLGDLVEGIYQNIVNLACDGALTVEIPFDNLIKKYSFFCS